jgi:hypothetical protein
VASNTVQATATYRCVIHGVCTSSCASADMLNTRTHEWYQASTYQTHMCVCKSGWIHRRWAQVSAWLPSELCALLVSRIDARRLPCAALVSSLCWVMLHGEVQS